MGITISFIMLYIVIILLLISLAWEWKRVKFKNEKNTKTIFHDDSYSELKDLINSRFNEFENRIIELLKLKKTDPLDNRERKNDELISNTIEEDVQIASENDMLSSCISFYNKAIESNNKEGEFHRNFRPFRADLKNDQERRSNPKLEPEFKTSDSGKYFVVEIQHSGSTDFAVFPIFELTISDKNYEIGAWGEVFKCIGYKDGFSFKINKVISPAFFFKEKDRWKLAAIGELNLIKR